MGEAAIVTDAKVTAYVRRYHNGRDAAALFAAIGDKFGAPAGWTVERVAELLALFAAGRAPKAPTPKMLKARDAEVKGLIRDMAEYLTSAAEVRAVVKERFGAERTPALSTVTALLASARYEALHAPRPEAPAEPAPPRPAKPKRAAPAVPRDAAWQWFLKADRRGGIDAAYARLVLTGSAQGWHVPPLAELIDRLARHTEQQRARRIATHPALRHLRENTETAVPR